MTGANSFQKRKTLFRIGPSSLFALVIVLCLAVLFALALSTANATNTMAQRQANQVTGVYANESAAQEFLAGADEVLATRGSSELQRSLSGICAAAEAAANGQVRATADFTDGVVHAQFENSNGRLLSIALTIRDDDTYRIDAWNTAAIQNEEQPQGNLLIID